MSFSILFFVSNFLYQNTQQKGTQKKRRSIMMSSPTNKEGENRLDPPPRASTASGSGDLVSEIQNVECFNAVTDWQFALTSGMRDAPTTSLDSEMDDPEVIVTVAFNQIVSLKSLSIHGKPGEERQSAPRTVKVFANKPNYQFDDCSNKKPTQKIVVGETECVFGGETIELDQVRDVLLLLLLPARRRRKAPGRRMKINLDTIRSIACVGEATFSAR